MGCNFLFFEFGLKSSGFHLWKCKKRFNLRDRKFHFPKYKEFFFFEGWEGWGISFAFWGCVYKVRKVALKTTIYISQFNNLLMAAQNVNNFKTVFYLLVYRKKILRLMMHRTSSNLFSVSYIKLVYNTIKTMKALS